MSTKKWFEVISSKIRSTVNISVDIENMKSAFFNASLYYFKVCGVMPISFASKVINNGKQYVFSESYSSVLYNLILICGVLVFSFYGFSTCDLDSFNQDDRIEYYFSHVLYKIKSVGMSLVLLTYCMQHKKLIALFNEIQSTIAKVQSQDRSKKLKLPCVKIFLIVVIYIFVVLASIIFSNMSDALCPTVFDAILIYRLIQNAVLFQYAVILKLIEHSFEVLNENLSILFSLNTINNVNVIFESTAGKSRLTKLKHSYSLLRNLCEDLSDFYSIPMLFCLLSVFMTLLGTTYSVTLPLLMRVLHVNYWTFSISTFYFLLCLFALLILTTNISTLTKESKKTSKIISHHLEVIRNPDIKEKLSQFSLDLLHTNIKFMVFDWFALDGSLLMSIAATITTYLVIVFQFQIQQKVFSTNQNNHLT